MLAWLHILTLKWAVLAEKPMSNQVPGGYRPFDDGLGTSPPHTVRRQPSSVQPPDRNARLHQQEGGDARPFTEAPMTAFAATSHALAALRGRLAPVLDDVADAAFFLADLRANGFDVQPFAGGSVTEAARDAAARALFAVRQQQSDSQEARSAISELRGLGFDVLPREGG